MEDVEDLRRGTRTRYEYEWTANLGVYNKARKKHLADKHGLCTYCKYHRGENDRGKWYGGRSKNGAPAVMRYPSWKLATKNRKQWMGKPRSYSIEAVTSRHYWGITYYEVTF